VNQPFIELATKEEYKDSQQMQQLYSDIIARGGEGIILRNANHRHKPGEEASEGELLLPCCVFFTMRLFRIYYSG